MANNAFTFNTYKASKDVKTAKKEADKYKNYVLPQNVVDAQNKMIALQNNKPKAWDGGTYGAMQKDYLQQYLNQKDFTYDLNGDALYQQYKNQYMTQGKLAMQDTMGQAAALTGGYGSSYAQTVGQQAYQGYLNQLNDVVPQLYQLAMNKYQMDSQNLLNRYNAVSDAYNTEYGEYNDNLNRYYQDLDYATDYALSVDRNARSDWEFDKTSAVDIWKYLNDTDYSRFEDNEARRLQEWQIAQALAESGGSGGSGGRRSSGSSGGNDSKFDQSAYNKAKNDVGNAIGNALKSGQYTTKDAIAKKAKAILVSYSNNVNDATYKSLYSYFSKTYGF